MTTPNPFQQPGKNGDFFSPKHHPEWLDRLFIFYPESSVMKTFDEKQGPKEFVIADVAVMDLADPQTGQPLELRGVSIGGVSMVPALNRDRIGSKVLARLRRGEPKGGNDGAFYLDAESLTQQDIAAATAYDASRTARQFNQPQTQQAPAQSAQYAQQQYGNGAPQGAYGQGGSVPQGQPQYAAQQLPYGAPAQGAPAGPGAGQWGQGPAAPPAVPPNGGAPAPGQQQYGQGAPSDPAATAAPAAAAPLDPQLVDFLRSRGVNPDGMSDGQARMVAQTFSQ